MFEPRRSPAQAQLAARQLRLWAMERCAAARACRARAEAACVRARSLRAQIDRGPRAHRERSGLPLAFLGICGPTEFLLENGPEQTRAAIAEVSAWIARLTEQVGRHGKGDVPPEVIAGARSVLRKYGL